MSLGGTFDARALGGLSSEQSKQIDEGNLIPEGEYVFEVGTVTAKFEERELGDHTYEGEELIQIQIPLRIAKGYGQVGPDGRNVEGKMHTEWLRVLNPRIPGLWETKGGLFNQISCSTLRAIIKAAQVPAVVDEQGNKNDIATAIENLPKCLVRAKVKIKTGEDDVPRNRVGSFKAVE